MNKLLSTLQHKQDTKEAAPLKSNSEAETLWGYVLAYDESKVVISPKGPSSTGNNSGWLLSELTGSFSDFGVSLATSTAYTVGGGVL